MKTSDPEKLDRRTEARVRVIVDLSRRRDRLLEAPALDLDALAALTADYESANMPCAAAELRRRLEWYRCEQDLAKK
jgi:Trk K+ transport system NAD-binding subunit